MSHDPKGSQGMLIFVHENYIAALWRDISHLLSDRVGCGTSLASATTFSKTARRVKNNIPLLTKIANTS